MSAGRASLDRDSDCRPELGRSAGTGAVREGEGGAMSARLLAAVFSLTLSAPVLAQQAQAPVTTPPVEVTATPIGSLTAPNVDEAREAIQRIPGGVNLVPAEQF